MKWFSGNGYSTVVYENIVKGEYPEFCGEGQDRFRNRFGVSSANRMAEELELVVGKLYSRGILNRDQSVFVLWLGC